MENTAIKFLILHKIIQLSV